MSARKTPKRAIIFILSAVLAAAVFCGVWFGIKRAGAKLLEKGLETTELNLRRGAAACYALEGRYPENLDYLMKNYGVAVDSEKYIVHYTVFASNIMPDITVSAR